MDINRLLPSIKSDIQKAARFYSQKSAAVIRFLVVIAEAYNGRHIGHTTARSITNSILQVYIPRIQIIDIPGRMKNSKKDILIRSYQIVRIFANAFPSESSI